MVKTRNEVMRMWQRHCQHCPTYFNHILHYIWFLGKIGGKNEKSLHFIEKSRKIPPRYKIPPKIPPPCLDHEKYL